MVTLKHLAKLLTFILLCSFLNTVSATKWHLHREAVVPLYCVALDLRDWLHCQGFMVYTVYTVYTVYMSELFAPKYAIIGGTL